MVDEPLFGNELTLLERRPSSTESAGQFEPKDQTGEDNGLF